MTKRAKGLYIIGAAEPGYEILDILQEPGKDDYKILGFFDEIRTGHGIVNKIDEMEAPSYFVISIGKVSNRKKLFRNLIEHGHHPVNVLSNHAFISKGAKVGQGVIVYPFSSLSYNISIENNVLINYNCSISHGTRIGDNSNISPGVRIAGNVSVGRDCFVGLGANIIEKVSICDKVFIGAGSTVINDITRPGIYVGSPCTYLKAIEAV
jgi:sugar O-acyltransferase (sialic acid O-acetyltransferase NeuD family)